MFYTIKQAIREQSRLRLSLAEGEYLVEPHVMGRTRAGKTVLRAYQLRGPRSVAKPASWRLFDLATIERAVEAGDRFERPRPGYKPNDPTMKGGIIEAM